MSSQPPENPPPSYAIRTRTTDAQGRIVDTLVTDPLRHRMNDPVLAPWVDTLGPKYPGLINNKAAMFGHLPKKEVERMKLNYQASAKLYDATRKIPSWNNLANSWFVSRVEGELELWMGADGAAINAENTRTNKQVNVEQKPGRLSLRR